MEVFVLGYRVENCAMVKSRTHGNEERRPANKSSDVNQSPKHKVRSPMSRKETKPACVSAVTSDGKRAKSEGGEAGSAAWGAGPKTWGEKTSLQPTWRIANLSIKIKPRARTY